MPGPLAIAAVASSVFSTGAQMFGTLKGADAKERAAEKQAKFTYAQRMEELRQFQNQTAAVEGEAVAKVYGSNLQMQGTPRDYVDSLRQEHIRQLNYGKRTANQERRMIEKGGESPGMNARLLGQAASGIASAIGAART